ncbi:MurR/RpiR family transcriptional regulator [Robertmurraya massiliosenegalensis]|uniref:MurR/RpiR family transcriptional regulator n=1 Tax=Robertmurraya massiliosenegalensis TaxID=1287657 RepID=UPI00030B34C8|nr:MurR/RpiR family transcriptional regulator [Robertmurraya massiliosenegalensis]
MSGIKMNGVITCLENLYPSLTGALKNVADVILENPELIVRENIKKLATISNSSDSAVVRLSQRLGYKGFRDLQISLAYELGDNNTYVDEEIGISESLDTIVNVVSQANINSLTEAREMLDQGAMERVVHLLQHARAIHIFAQGTNYSTGVDLSYNLMKLGILCNVYNDSYMQAVAGAISDPKDIAIGISHTGANRDVIESLAITRQNGGTTIALTTRKNSPITQIVDISLTTANKEIVFLGEPFSSRMSLMYLVDILFLGLASKMGRSSLNSLLSVKDALKSKRDPKGLPDDKESTIIFE